MNIKNVINRLVSQVFKSRTEVIYILSCSAIEEPRFQEGEHLVVLSKDNLTEHAALCEQFLAFNAANSEYLDEIAKQRVLGFFVLSNDSIVHFSFLFIRNRMSHILGLQEGYVRLGHSFTVPSYRGRGCQGRSLLARAAVAGELGYKWVATETTPENVSSRRGMEKAGMQLIGRMDLIILCRYFVIRWRRPKGFALLGLCF